jgi:hypothetical protein
MACSVLSGQAMAGVALHVQPHQRFGGTVNDATGNATIAMACFGPTHPGQTGHPMAGQHLGIFIPEVLMSPAFGNTGAHARAVVARIVTASDRPIQVAVFTRFTRTGALYSATKRLSTTITLPCATSGTVVFTPVPGGAGAQPATVTVAFTGQP